MASIRLPKFLGKYSTKEMLTSLTGSVQTKAHDNFKQSPAVNKLLIKYHLRKFIISVIIYPNTW